MTLTPTPALQISLLLGPRRALRSELPARSVQHPQRLSLPRVLISLLEGLLQNLSVVFPCVPPCWDQEAGGQDQVEEIRRALTLPTGHLALCLGVYRLSVPLHRSEVLHFLVSEGWCGCAHLSCILSIGTYSSNLAGQLTCKCLDLYLHCGQPCCSIAFLKSVCNTFSDWK